MRGISKFDQLRMKTDRELLQLVRKELNFGLSIACQALVSVEDGASLEDSFAKAERAYREASRWFCLIDEITAQEHAKVQFDLNRLQALLKELAVRRSAEISGRDRIGALALS